MKNLDKLGYQKLFLVFVGLIGFYILIRFNVPLIIALVFSFYVLGFWGYKLIRTLYKDWLVTSDFIGGVEISQEEISIDSGELVEIKFHEVAQLFLKYNYIQGKLAFRYDVIHNGIWHLTLELKTGEIKEVKFLVENQEQFERLISIFRAIYRAGVKVKERLGNEEVKTILFQIQPSYAQIQALKAELRVDSFE